MAAVTLLCCVAATACKSSAGSASTQGAPAATTTGTVAAVSAAAAPSVSASASPAAAGDIDSCAVVTPAQAGAALRQTVRPGVLGKATVEGGLACVFYGPAVPAGTDPDIPVGDSVRVVLVVGSEAAHYYDDYKGKVPAVAVPGLGDQAFYDGSASLSVLKGSDYVRIAVIGASNTLAAEEQLARDALPLM